jgi:hypothetical protein
VNVRAIAVAVISMGGTACDSSTSPDPVPGSPGWREAQAVAVYEAVHRAQFTEHASGAPPAGFTFCLAREDGTGSLPWADPSDALISRFATHAPVVKKVSSCRIDLRGDTDVETGRPAIVFRAGPLGWESDTEVVLDGGHHRGGLDASGQTYRVRYQEGRWTVVEVVWRWIA